MNTPSRAEKGDASAVDYRYPASIKEAIGLLWDVDGAAQIVAGGTDLLPDIRKGRIQPRCLVDITRIPGLDRIGVTETHVEVGAAVTFAALARDRCITRCVHALSEAARCVGARAIQNAATWVGNLVQAMPAADGAIVALALDAEAHVVGRSDRGWRPVESLFLGPGLSAIDPTREVVSHVRFPIAPGRWGTGWHRLGRRPSLVLPILNCAAYLSLGGGPGIEPATIEQARIALGPVAPTPYRARRAEQFLEGKPALPEVLAQAAALVREDANPRDSVSRASRAYRLDILPPLVEAALHSALAHALGTSPACRALPSR